jgi:ribose transport system substrate-binding protein
MRFLMTLGLGFTVSLGSAGIVAAQQPTIAVFTKNFTNPAYEAFRIGADQIAKAANARTIHFIPKKPDNVDEQTAQVEQVLKDRPDIILFTPVDDKAMIEPVKKLNDAKIPVVLFTNPLPGTFVTFVGADDVEIGYKEARYLLEKLGGKGRIVVIEGPPAAPTNRDRLHGFKRAFADFPGIQVLGSGIGNYQRPDAQRAMAKLLQDHSQFDAVLATNDGMALGALDALKEAGRTAVVMGINGNLDAVRLIETGSILATVDFNTFKMGCLAAHAALRHLKGLPVPEKIMLPAEIIDKTNYKAWLVPVGERPCPKWEEIVR